MCKEDYERIGRLIFSTLRHGGSEVDLKKWMAAEAGLANTGLDEDSEDGSGYQAFQERYPTADAFEEACLRFLATLKGKSAQ